jgi:hypothetical protein
VQVSGYALTLKPLRFFTFFWEDILIVFSHIEG